MRMNSYKEKYLVQDVGSRCFRGFLLFSIVFLISMECFAEPSPEKEEYWMIQCHCGKGHKPYEKQNSFTFNDFTDYRNHLSKISNWPVLDYLNSTEEEITAFLPKNLKITEIGDWGKYKVFDVTQSTIKHKSIVLQEKNKQYHVLYLQFASSLADIKDLPEIFSLNDDKFLGYDTEIPGTGNFRHQHYYMLDKDSGIPKEVDFSPMYSHIKTALPTDHAIWKGGGLNFKKMMYRKVVHKKGDGNGSPSGGEITLKLKLIDGEITIVETHYDPDKRYN